MPKPPQPPFALTVSPEARAVMTPMLANGSAPELTMTLMRNAITRRALRAVAANHLKPLNKGRAKRFGVDTAKSTIAGVPVKFVRRQGIDEATEKRLLINFGEGRVSDNQESYPAEECCTEHHDAVSRVRGPF